MMNTPFTSEERHWAMAAHLCGLLWLAGGPGLVFFPLGSLVLFTMLGPLIIWRSKRETMPFAAEQAKESLNFQITVFLLGLLFALLIVVLIGVLLLWLLGLVDLILVIVAAIKANDGVPYRYPFCLRLIQ